MFWEADSGNVTSLEEQDLKAEGTSQEAMSEKVQMEPRSDMAMRMMPLTGGQL